MGSSEWEIIWLLDKAENIRTSSDNNPHLGLKGLRYRVAEATSSHTLRLNSHDSQAGAGLVLFNAGVRGVLSDLFTNFSIIIRSVISTVRKLSVHRGRSVSAPANHVISPPIGSCRDVAKVSASRILRVVNRLAANDLPLLHRGSAGRSIISFSRKATNDHGYGGSTWHFCGNFSACQTP
jgi:hypothetical protein